jgi:hypothetical protein
MVAGDSNGNIYGLTEQGDRGYGAIYEFAP